MSEISALMVKQLRDSTGAPMAKCKEALVASSGDMELAVSHLRKAGIASAVKKESREANEGVIACFESPKEIVLVEVNSETDFVSNNERFRKFADEVAKEIASGGVTTVEQLLQKKSSVDPSHTIDERRASLIQTLGENIRIRRFEIFLKKKGSSIAFYSHSGGKLVTLVEIGGSDALADLAREVAMHVAAEAPEYLSKEEVPERVIAHEKEIAQSQVKGKPEAIIAKIVEGKINTYFKQVCLLYQPFIKDNNVTIESLVSSKDKNAKIVQFLRWRVGQ